jgi:hypothetical protein
MKRLLALAVVAAFAAACSDRPAPTQPGGPSFLDVTNGQTHVHVMPVKAQAFGLADAPPPGKGGGGKNANTGILYHGGPVLYQTNVVAVYWAGAPIYSGGPTPGTSGPASADGSLIGYFLSNLGGSPYYNINTTYFDGTGTHVQNVVTYTGFWAANTNVPASGSTVSDAEIQAQLISGFTSGALTFDQNTLYEVFSGPGVNLGGGFGTRYCAYHGRFTWNGNDVKYSAMPHDGDFPSGCAALVGSPNNDFAADAEVNTLAHETEETTTDPDLNAWFDTSGQEDAERCNFKFGPTQTAPNGAKFNETFGGFNWMIQMQWENSRGGGCDQFLGGPFFFS